MSAFRDFLKSELERIDALLQRVFSLASSSFAIISALPPPLPRGELDGLPNDNLRRTVLSIPVNQPKPYFIVFTFQARNGAGLCQWQRQHICIHGDPAAPVIVPSIGGGDFQTTEAGYGATPTVFVVIDPLAPNVDLQASNPVAQGAAIDVSFTVDVLDVGPV